MIFAHMKDGYGLKEGTIILKCVCYRSTLTKMNFFYYLIEGHFSFQLRINHLRNVALTGTDRLHSRVCMLSVNEGKINNRCNRCW